MRLERKSNGGQLATWAGRRRCGPRSRLTPASLPPPIGIGLADQQLQQSALEVVDLPARVPLTGVDDLGLVEVRARSTGARAGRYPAVVMLAARSLDATASR